LMPESQADPMAKPRVLNRSDPIYYECIPPDPGHPARL
jgi:hypothetical protein